MRRRKAEPGSLAGADADPRAARLAALKLLNRRDFGSRELTQKLADRGFPVAVAEATVADLARERMVDDARYAERYVAAHADRGQGPVRIAAELRQLGVDPDAAAAALDAHDSEWHDRCATVRQRRFGAHPPKSLAERAKQARFLQYRGFRTDSIRHALGSRRGSAADDDLLQDESPPD